MIAHRLHTLKNCDLILVLDQGRLAGVRRVQPGAMLDAVRFVLGQEQSGSTREAVAFSEGEEDSKAKRAAASD
jgi:ABC-type sugar transport system ATPase subunit